MQISYNDRTDLLHIRLDDRKQDLRNQRVSEDIVLDLGADDTLIGIEILNASRHVDLTKLFPIEYGKM